jgi:diamine N-acetyltransferase
MLEKSSTRDSNTTVTLREVTKENLHLVLRLKVKPEQERLVASNAVSIAQAHFWETAWFRAIYVDDTPIGFVMLNDTSLSDKNEVKDDEMPGGSPYYLWRFMIDGEHQGRGYGRHAMELVIEHVRSRPHATGLTLHHEKAEGNAGEFYRKSGFEYTGNEHDGELEMRLTL